MAPHERKAALRFTGSREDDYGKKLGEMGGSQQDAMTDYVRQARQFRQKQLKQQAAATPSAPQSRGTSDGHMVRGYANRPALEAEGSGDKGGHI